MILAGNWGYFFFLPELFYLLLENSLTLEVKGNPAELPCSSQSPSSSGVIETFRFISYSR